MSKRVRVIYTCDPSGPREPAAFPSADAGGIVDAGPGPVRIVLNGPQVHWQLPANVRTIEIEEVEV